MLLGLACEPGIVSAPTIASSLRLSPRGQSMEVGDSLRLTAAALDRSGTILISSRAITWSVETPGIVRVDSTGWVHGRLPGTALLRATVDGFSDTVSVTILPPSVQAVRFAPDTATIILGTSRQLVANAYGKRDTLLAGRPMEWSTNAPGVATVSPAGVVTATGLGSALITATAEGHADTAEVTIIPVPVKRLVVTPNPASVQLGSSLQLAADPQDSTGASLSGRAVSWSSNATAIATVSATGLVTAVANGNTSIVATSEGIVTTVPLTVAAPSIALSATTVAFTDRATGSNPAAQVVNVTNGGSFTLSGLARAITYGGGQPTGWLSATLSTTTAPATLTLQATTGSLAPGTYTATVQLTSSQPGVAAQNVGVTFIVTPQPQIGLSATAPVFGALTSGPNPAAQVIDVTNSGTGTLSNLTMSTTYTGGGQTGWLTSALNATTAPTTITLQPVTGSLPTGTYTATVTVSSSQPFVTSRTINVTFNVVAGPAIGLSASAAGFSRVAFATAPQQQVINVTNIGNGTLDGLSSSITYTGGAATGWLTAPLAGTSAPTSMTLTASAASLAAGTYTARVDVASTVPGAVTQSVDVTLTVAPQPAIGVSPSSASFTMTRGAGAPAAQALSVTNSGGTTSSLTGLSISGISYGAGATGWLSSSSVGATAPTTLTVTPAGVSSLAGGVYTATISLASTVPGVASVDVPVTLTVQQPQLGLSTSAIGNGSVTRGAAMSSDVVTVSNTGAGTLSGLATSISYGVGGTNWITGATLGSTSITGSTTLTISYNSANLAAGSNSATITVSSTVPGVASQQVTITTTGLQPQIGLSPSSFSRSLTISGTSSQAITISNSGSGTLNAPSVGAISYSGGQSGWASISGLTAGGFTVNINTAGITNAGTYTATIPVQSTQPGVLTQNVTVTLTASWSYATHIAPLLATCNGCHTYTMSYAALVNVAPTMAPCNATASNRRILPGNAAASVLYSKVSTLAPFCGVAMPQGTTVTWSASELTRLREWINAGAPNN